MTLRSNKITSSQQISQHLDELIQSHRAYFSEWRTNKFSSVKKQPHEAEVNTSESPVSTSKKRSL